MSQYWKIGQLKGWLARQIGLEKVYDNVLNSEEDLVDGSGDGNSRTRFNFKDNFVVMWLISLGTHLLLWIFCLMAFVKR